MNILVSIVVVIAAIIVAQAASASPTSPAIGRAMKGTMAKCVDARGTPAFVLSK